MAGSSKSLPPCSVHVPVIIHHPSPPDRASSSAYGGEILHRIPQAFSKEQAAEVTQNVWTRLGMDPEDKSTWHALRTNMPSHRSFDASELAPRAWAAICELCGGEVSRHKSRNRVAKIPRQELILVERRRSWLTPKSQIPEFYFSQDRVNPASKQWRDSLIVNLGSPASENKPDPPQALQGWHVDGDFFVHYLDSPEQGLLVIPLFTDIPPQGGGGGTMLYPAGMRAVARHLHDHPEGVSPRMIPRGDPGFDTERNPGWFNALGSRGGDDHRGGEEEEGRNEYVEAGGRTGDVYLLHPLMLHSATNNPLRNVRIITNPPVSLREPFNFDRADGQYSLVERATLRMLGKEAEGLRGWKITHARERVVPERLRIQERMRQEELRRLGAERHGATAVA